MSKNKYINIQCGNIQLPEEFVNKYITNPQEDKVCVTFLHYRNWIILTCKKIEITDILCVFDSCIINCWYGFDKECNWIASGCFLRHLYETKKIKKRILNTKIKYKLEYITMEGESEEFIVIDLNRK